MPSIFDALYAAATPFVLPGILYKLVVLNKYRESLPAMLGHGLPEHAATAVEQTKEPPRTTTAWLHAVSVGEVVAAGAVLKHLEEQRPDWRYLASTVTETGQAKARQTLKQADDIFYYPLDLSWIVRRFFDHYRPEVYIIHETELWPNFLLEARRRGVAVFLANGKLSPRSTRRYRKARVLFAKPLEAFSVFCMQTEGDAERLRSLGVSPDRIHITGNCKFDAPGEALPEEARRDWRQRLGWKPDARVVVAGSTHPGEEEIVLKAFHELRGRFPDVRLLLAPRHPERFDAVAERLESGGWTYWRVSHGDTSSGERTADSHGPDVVLLDTIGQLARAYGLGQVALCGGSWVPIGGHNLLEAAAHSIPVLRGPFMQNQPEIVRILGPEEGGLCVEAQALGSELQSLFEDEDRRRELGRKAAEAVARNRGAAARTVEIILNHLPAGLR